MSARPRRFLVPGESDPTDHTGCSTQSCRSCGASALAGCVALCCCPCAVVSFFTLALVKAPYVAGRRCVRLVKSRRGSPKKRVTSLEDQQEGRLSKESESAELGRRVSSGSESESESVWAEMYEVGRWGFGRVSSSGIGPRGRSNLGN